MTEHKRIEVRDLNVGDMVVGTHVEFNSMKVVAGDISRKNIDKDGNVIYYVQGKTLPRPFGEPLNFSGILMQNEVQVIDPQICRTIIELYDLTNRQIIAGSQLNAASSAFPYRETVEKINEMRHKARAQLEEKYGVVEV
jgi:hypothetical protein